MGVVYYFFVDKALLKNYQIRCQVGWLMSRTAVSGVTVKVGIRGTKSTKENVSDTPTMKPPPGTIESPKSILFWQNGSAIYWWFLEDISH